MSRLSLLAGLSLAACAVACDGAPTGPVTPAAPRAAVIEHWKNRPFQYTIWRCTEFVEVQGTERYLFILGDSLDTTHRTLFKFQLRETGTAVGLTSGSRYRFSEMHSHASVVDWDSANPPWTATDLMVTRMMSLDTMPDFLARFRLHVTVNAVGDTVVNRMEYEASCP